VGCSQTGEGITPVQPPDATKPEIEVVARH